MVPREEAVFQAKSLRLSPEDLQVAQKPARNVGIPKQKIFREVTF